MKRSLFDYTLPSELIAHYPATERTSSRLLSLNGETGQMTHGVFHDLIEKINAGDLLIFNNTKVIPARVFGRKATGGKIEVLVERVIDQHKLLAHIRSSKSPKPGSLLLLGESDPIEAIMVARRGALFELSVASHNVLDMLEAIGHMPLPPYIERHDEQTDYERYQTVYAREKGAVAAPTAGLHFDNQMIEMLRQKGVEIGYVTLHVGAGTFQPVRVDNILQHEMHSEALQTSATVCQQVATAKRNGKRVIAVGTTSVRCLETAAREGEIKPYEGETNIFIYPGYQFKIVDALITNFHLPESTLIMLVSAFAGYHNTIRAYQTAIADKYRFYSYGDAMFITRNPQSETEDDLRVI